MLIKTADDLSSKYRLLELPPDNELMQCVRDGAEIVIKGNENDEVVLCSEYKTFRVREVHTSNLSFLVDGNTIEGMTNTYLEAFRIPPQTERLHKWLEARPYEGPESPLKDEILDRLHHDRLFGEIQASNDEIRTILHDFGAILIDGRYRILGADYQCRCFGHLFSSLILLDLQSTETIWMTQIREIFRNNDEFPENILEHFLSLYGSIETDSLRLNPSKVCRFFAKELLKARSIWTMSDFMRAWSKLTYDFAPSKEMLFGMAYFEPIPGDVDVWVKYFPAANLPIEPIARFAKLFETSPRWEYGVFETFVEDAAKALGVGPADLIVKYARVSIDPTTLGKIVTPLVFT